MLRNKPFELPPFDESDPVRAHLASHGWADHVVRGGLEGLIKRWEGAARFLGRGQSLDVLEYLNGMDGRQAIHEVTEVMTDDQWEAVEARLAAADEAVRAVTVPTAMCLWGEGRALQGGFRPEVNWWYYRRPLWATGYNWEGRPWGREDWTRGVWSLFEKP